MAVWAARASPTIADTSLRTAATICSLMVLASCRLVASAVRHHNRLDAAAVNRIVVNTSADTARWMLIVSGLPVERGGGPLTISIHLAVSALVLTTILL